MKLRKGDFGAEILSILTRGMYLDPKDALREYVQNGVDARANRISVKIRQSSIIVEDNGNGMNIASMRKAIRLGVSDKVPSKDVGFMGIGIYSSFHLCNKLIIYSRTEQELPNKLTFDFKSMRNILEEQKKVRFDEELDEEKLMDLQTILEKYIELIPLTEKDFSKIGTRVEMIGVEPEFYQEILKFNDVANYLQQVVPLPFDPKFRWAQAIEKKIHEICEEHNAVFEVVTLNLQVNERQEDLFRPYKDSSFGGKPLKPNFFQLKNEGDFFGVIWGCLNSKRSAVRTRKLRGYIIRKQGFAIGARHDLVKYFGKATLFNRYIGEIIVVHPRLLPNASRTDFEYSPLRVAFYDCLRTIAAKLNKRANDYQEFTLSNEKIDESIVFVKETRATLNYIADNADKLLNILIKLKDQEEQLKKRFKRGFIEDKRISDYNKLIRIIYDLIKDIRILIENQKKEKIPTTLKSTDEIAKEINKVPSESGTSSEEMEEDFNSLADVVEAIGIEIPNNLKIILDHLDEIFIFESSDDLDQYQLILKKLKQDFDELIYEE